MLITFWLALVLRTKFMLAIMIRVVLIVLLTLLANVLTTLIAATRMIIVVELMPGLRLGWWRVNVMLHILMVWELQISVCGWQTLTGSIRNQVLRVISSLWEKVHFATWSAIGVWRWILLSRKILIRILSAQICLHFKRRRWMMNLWPLYHWSILSCCREVGIIDWLTPIVYTLAIYWLFKDFSFSHYSLFVFWMGYSMI